MEKRGQAAFLRHVASLGLLLILMSGVSAAESVDDYLLRAQKLGNHGKYKEAVAECEKAIKLAPDSLKAHAKLLEFINYQVPIHYKMVKKKLYKFMPEMDTMEFIDPKELQPEYDAIRAKLNELKDRIEARLAKEPKSANFHLLRGYCLNSEANIDMQYDMAVQQYKKNYTAAFGQDPAKMAQVKAAYEKAVECEPNNANGYVALAGMELFRIQAINTRRQTEQAMKGKRGYNPYGPVELDAESKVLLASAKEKIKKALELDAENPGIHFSMAELYKLDNNLEKQVFHLKKAIMHDPYNALYRFYLGSTYQMRVSKYLHGPMMQGAVRPRKMAKVRKKMMAEDGITQEDVNRMAWNAIYAFETATKLTSNESKFFKRKDVQKMIDMLLQMSVFEQIVGGDYERVIAVLSKQLRTNPDSPSLYSCLGYYYTSLYGKDKNKANLAKGIECYEKVVELAPGQFRTHKDLVFLYLYKWGEGDESALAQAKKEYRWVQENDKTKDGYWKKGLSADLTLQLYGVEKLLKK